MNKTKISLLLLLMMSAFTLHAQFSVKGRITDENKNPVAKASISLSQKLKSFNASTNDEGFFEISNLVNGKYEIVITAIGFERQVELVTINGSDTELNFSLTISSSQLQKVEVIGRAARKYNSDYSFGATRTAILNKDLPQAIGTVTKELIADRQAFQLADAVKIIPGVIPSSFYN